MSATIYNINEYLKTSPVPDIFQDGEKYQELEKQWIEDLQDYIREFNGVGQYIGRTISFPVADGEAIYMIKSLSPVELIHLPLMDAYQFQYAHLMTASELKKQIDANDKWDAFQKTQCTVGEVNEFLEEFADEVYDMPDHALELLMDDHICVKWYNPIGGVGEKEYFVPENNSFYGEWGKKVYNYLERSFLV
tara:strand:+ start:3621 stop:4196 length:576 start_codon:yes stop_codon:yes gene_type:complete